MTSITHPGSLILMYHRMGSPIVRSIVPGQYVFPLSIHLQVRQLLAKGYRPATLAAMCGEHACAPGYFCVSFDDGYATVRRKAFPVLQKLGVPATLFIVSSGIGKTNFWDERIGDCTEYMLDEGALREMIAFGCEIGSHTVTHAHLPALSDTELRAELVDSKHALEDRFGVPVVSFAYPYGEWDARVRDAVQQAGYRYAALTHRGAIGPHADLLTMPRVNMRWNSFGLELHLKFRSAFERSGLL